MNDQSDNSSDSITIGLVGDMMLGRLVNEPLAYHGPAYVWGDTLPLLKRADLTIGNLECVIAGRSTGRPWARWPKVFHFKSDPVAIKALQLAGFDCVLLANNHVLDFGQEALLEMLGLLDQAGIQCVGAGRNHAEAARPVLLTASGVRVGVVSFTDNEPGWGATEGEPGTNWIPVSLDESSLGAVRESIAPVRDAGAQLVIFSIHWGPNMVQRPSSLFRNFARAVIDAGADVFLGHSAHLFQGIEVYSHRPIIYDAGDFVDDYVVDPVLRNDLGLLFLLRVRTAGTPFAPSGRSSEQDGARACVERIDMVPVHIAACQANLARGPERREIIARMTVLCSELGTTARTLGDRLRVDCLTG